MGAEFVIFPIVATLWVLGLILAVRSWRLRSLPHFLAGLVLMAPILAVWILRN